MGGSYEALRWVKWTREKSDQLFERLWRFETKVPRVRERKLCLKKRKWEFANKFRTWEKNQWKLESEHG